MKKTALLFCISTFVACTSQEDLQLCETDSPCENQLAYITIPDTSRIVTIQTVENIARSFPLTAAGSRYSEEREILSVEAVNDEDGAALFYVVNYKDNRGFLVVSATKDYAPILAYSESGRFCMDRTDETGVSLWLKEQKAAIASVDQLPDSVKLHARSLWTDYNTHREELKPQSRSREDVVKLISSSVNQWESEGYIVYRLSEYKYTDEFNNLPQEVRTHLLELPLGYANPNYGGREQVSFVLKRNDQETHSYGPLLQTFWGQKRKYNQYTPNNYFVGCVAVAMGQIMKYHQYPTSYDWGAMENSEATPTTAQLLADIGTAVGMEYSSLGSSSNIDKACDAFNNVFGYTKAQVVNHESGSVKQQIEKNLPVYMRGKSKGDGHAWVCDGYVETISYGGCLKLMTLEDCPEDYEPQMFLNPYTYDDTSKSPVVVYWHMNWGWYGNNDGYYVTPEVKGYDFTNKRKNIINIYPVK